MNQPANFTQTLALFAFALAVGILLDFWGRSAANPPEEPKPARAVTLTMGKANRTLVRVSPAKSRYLN